MNRSGSLPFGDKAREKLPIIQKIVGWCFLGPGILLFALVAIRLAFGD
jgi:hypothetical protein